MHQTVKISALVALVLTLAACATARVATDHDREARFAELNSFAWLEPMYEVVDDPLLDSPLLGAKVQRAAVSELTDRGYQRTSAPEADFLVTFHVTSRERISDHGGVSVGVGYGRFRSPFHSSIFIGDRFGGVRSYQEGTLIIDILDARTNQLIWRGWVRDPVQPGRYTDEAVERSVRQILSRFPPGA